MKGKILIAVTLVCLILLFSCERDKLEPQADFDWIQMDVPEAGTIYSLSGNIDNELIVGGLGGIRKTSNRGLMWSIVHDSVTAYELRKKQDTLFAIALYNSSYQDYYSIDNGDTWELYSNKSLDDLRTSTVTSSNGTIYKIVYSETYPAQPDQLLKSSDGGFTWIDIFPYKRSLYLIYLDDDDRLYLGANGWEWNESTNSFDTDSGDNNGVIYYIKK